MINFTCAIRKHRRKSIKKHKTWTFLYRYAIFITRPDVINMHVRVIQESFEIVFKWQFTHTWHSTSSSTRPTRVPQGKDVIAHDSYLNGDKTLYGVHLTADASCIFDIKQYYIRITARCTIARISWMPRFASDLSWRRFRFVAFFINLSLRINTET